METGNFPLGNAEDRWFVRGFRIIFGIACIVMAAYWLNFNLRSLKTDWSLWVTIFFLLGFGFYQIWAGLGRAVRYIVVNPEMILMKKYSLRPPVKILPADISKIDIFPLNIYFIMKSGKKLLLRFGTIHYETNEKIVDEIIRFADSNSIPYELNEETI